MGQSTDFISVAHLSEVSEGENAQSFQILQDKVIHIVRLLERALFFSEIQKIFSTINILPKVHSGHSTAGTWWHLPYIPRGQLKISKWCQCKAHLIFTWQTPHALCKGVKRARNSAPATCTCDYLVGQIDQELKLLRGWSQNHRLAIIGLVRLNAASWLRKFIVEQGGEN